MNLNEAGVRVKSERITDGGDGDGMVVRGSPVGVGLTIHYCRTV